jgi:hypothetical protein
LHFLTIISQFSQGTVPRVIPVSSIVLLALASWLESSKKGDAYNLLWALVFGFATLNILSLVAKRFDPDRNRMSFGEILAIGTVILAVILLGWEMLYLFKILPLRLSH